MNNFEGLSKPVGFVGLKNIISLAEGNLGVISPNAAFGEEPVYSKEYVNLLISELEAAEAALSAANEKHRWIKCSDRLPEEMTDVLVCDAFSGVTKVMAHIKDGEFFPVRGMQPDHWMPLLPMPVIVANLEPFDEAGFTVEGE
ncbi:DUF551 domain-containing protein [Yersinia frederiksenii]|uniref:DUF551 domain-containing protein n=1 Tax=Yersinia frederiksenii TaxID=29484 RepID=UPI0005DF3FAC|nr:DUF551 domain-containing protein [Yersinia frederiksenii]CQH42068.1 Protein of uncharacterised function (DUF551) [Yersinia frederiksenii]